MYTRLVDNYTYFRCKWRLFKGLCRYYLKISIFFLVVIKHLIFLSTYSIDNVLLSFLYILSNVPNAAPYCMLLLLIPYR